MINWFVLYDPRSKSLHKKKLRRDRYERRKRRRIIRRQAREEMFMEIEGSPKDEESAEEERSRQEREKYNMQD